MAANFSFAFLFAPVKVNRRFHDGDGMINFRYLVTILMANPSLILLPSIKNEAYHQTHYHEIIYFL
jgi:hypothetical protein